VLAIKFSPRFPPGRAHNLIAVIRKSYHSNVKEGIGEDFTSSRKRNKEKLADYRLCPHAEDFLRLPDLADSHTIDPDIFSVVKS
jgi:hypothetical protein